jgi:hypothetical protein
MLVYAAYVAVLVLLVVGVWFAWHRLGGRKPPEVEDDEKGPPPSGRDERWDPRRRYGDEPTDPDTAGRAGDP